MPTATIRYFGFLASALVITLPLSSLAFDIGVTIDLSRLFAIAALLAIVTCRSFTELDHRSVGYLGLFWLFTTFLTFGMSMVTPNHDLADQSFLRNSTTRWIVQWIMLSAKVCSFLLAFQLGRIGLAGRINRSYVAVGLLLSSVGAIQLILWLLGISEPFMISLREGWSAATARQAHFTVGSFKFFRLSSLGGEPKHLAASLAPLVAMMGVWASSSYSYATEWRKVLQWILILVIFVFTFSTGAFFGLATSIPLIVLLCGKHLTLRSAPAAALVVVAAGFGLTISSSGTSNGATDVASAVFEARVTSRLGDIDHFEKAALDFMEDQPLTALFGVGVGNIPFYTYPYLEEAISSKADLSYLAGNTLPMSSFALTTLIESGLLGFCLLLTAQISILASARRALVSPTNTAGETHTLLGLTAASVVCVVLQLFSFCAIQYIVLGATAGLSQRLLRRRLYPRHYEPEALEPEPADLMEESPTPA